MKMRTMIAAGTAMLLCAVGLTACSGDDGGGGGETGGKVEMTFWHNASTGAGKTFWDETVAAS